MKSLQAVTIFPELREGFESGIQSFLSEKQCSITSVLTRPVPGLRASILSINFWTSKGLTRQVEGCFVFVSGELIRFSGQRYIKSCDSFTFPPRVDFFNNCEKFGVVFRDKPDKFQDFHCVAAAFLWYLFKALMTLIASFLLRVSIFSMFRWTIFEQNALRLVILFWDKSRIYWRWAFERKLLL